MSRITFPAVSCFAPRRFARQGLVCCAASLSLGLLGASLARANEPPDSIDTEVVESSAGLSPMEPGAAFALMRAQAAQASGGWRGPTLEGSVETSVLARPQLRQGGVASRLVDTSNRVWLGWGRAAFGVGLVTQSPLLDNPGVANVALAVQPVRPRMSIGWRYSVTPTSSLYAGASAARAWGPDDGLPLYGAKAGIEWKAATSRLGFQGGRLGLQLDSGYRMSIRTRSGGVQVALRRTF